MNGRCLWFPERCPRKGPESGFGILSLRPWQVLLYNFLGGAQLGDLLDAQRLGASALRNGAEVSDRVCRRTRQGKPFTGGGGNFELAALSFKSLGKIIRHDSFVEVEHS